MDDTLALLIVNQALIRSYPSWTDENGTNTEQLAEIAVRALAEHGLLVEAGLAVEDEAQSAGSAQSAQSARSART